MEEMSCGNSMAFVMTVVAPGGVETVRGHTAQSHTLPFSFPCLLGRGLVSSMLSVLGLLQVKLTKWSTIYCFALGKARDFYGLNFRKIHQANFAVLSQCFSDPGSTVGTSLPYLARTQCCGISLRMIYQGVWNIRKAFQDTGHCSWATSKLLCLMCVTGAQRTSTGGVRLAEGSQQQRMPQLSVCFWSIHACFSLSGSPSLGVGQEFQHLASYYSSHGNDNSHSLSSISCVFSNVLNTTSELAFNPHNHHTRTEKTDGTVTKFLHHHSPY